MAGEKETGQLSNDRISELPDHILLHILSFLTTKQVVQTSVLSKRCKFLWTGIPEINLIEISHNDEKLSRFVDLVGRMLIMCCGIHLNKFSVEFPAAQFITTVNLWAQFLVKYKVKYVDLRNLDDPDGEMYMLPQVLYSHSFMLSLTIYSLRMDPLGAIKWASLKRLTLVEVDLSDCGMTKILLGSPNLEYLKLSGCWGLSNLNLISSPTLATLIIEDNLGEGGDAIGVLEISAPHVIDLSIIDTNEERFEYEIKNASSVVRAKISFGGETEMGDTEAKNRMKQSLRSLHSVKDLELGPWFILVLSEMEVEGMKSPTFTLKSLTLNAWADECSIPGILSILKSSPMLEILAIIVDHCYLDLENTELVDQAAAYLQNANMDLVLSHLKTIKITTFAKSIDSIGPMVTLVQILLKGATHLEKMIISAKKLDINKLEAKLIAFPRASAKSVVVFE